MINSNYCVSLIRTVSLKAAIELIGESKRSGLAPKPASPLKPETPARLDKAARLL